MPESPEHFSWSEAEIVTMSQVQVRNGQGSENGTVKRVWRDFGSEMNMVWLILGLGT